jgi:Cof subfamily protein (haloacid dehalogenase superfamily)
MHKLYITDLDHTFLHSSQRVSDFSKKIWNEKADHALLSVATARSFSKTHEFLQGLPLKAPLILLDGAMVATTEKKLIDVQTLSAELSSAIIQESHAFEIQPFVISLNSHQSLEETFAIPPLLNDFQSFLIGNNYATDKRLAFRKKIEGVEDTLKIVYMGNENLLRPLSEHLKKVFGNRIEVKLAPENYMKCYFLTILHPLGDKAHALNIVHEYLDYSAEETTVFGDSLNDIGMFKLAGTAVAVSNALTEVKELADIVLTKNNDKDAVAHYLKTDIATN